jgi:hypothetical protein
MAKPSHDDEITRLYSLPLEEFTDERNVLVKRLREDGNRDAADEVKGLKKPNQAAWAINRAVRADPDAVSQLIEAGERLSDAQTSALKGKGADELREAMAAQQAAVETMMAAIGETLGDDQPGAAILDRVRETLRAVAGDEELRDEFVTGRVTRDREAVGFGGAPVTPARGKSAPKRKRSPSAAKLRQAETAQNRAQRTLDAAVKRARDAGRRLERAEKEIDAAKKALNEAEREQTAAESELADARAVAQELRD